MRQPSLIWATEALLFDHLVNPGFWVGLGELVVANLLLSGDNAVVIALAALITFA